METDIEISEGVATVSISGELDAHTAPELKERVIDALGEGVRWVMVDLEQTDFLDSSGLGTLVGIGKRAGRRSGDIAVVCRREHLLRVFDISGTRELLNVVESRQAARELIQQWRGQAENQDGCQQEGDSR